jgi:hypothetical protein
MPGGVERAGRAARLRPRARLPTGGGDPRADRPSRRSGTWCLAALGLVCTWPALGAQIDYGVGLSATYESNMFRTTSDPRPEIYESIMGAVNLREDNRDLNVRMLAQIEHRHFTKHTFPDDTTSYLDGAALWTITPQRATWTLEDTFREVQLSLTAPNTPSNRTKSNTMNTGPDLTFAVDGANSVIVGGRYGRFDVQNSVTDNWRYGGYLRGLHLLSLQSKVSLNYETWRVNFEPVATPYPKVLQQNAYARYESLYAGSGATIDVGLTRITRYGTDTLSGNLGRLTLLRAFGPDMTLRVAYSNEISDTYSDLLRGVTLAGVPTDPAVVVVQGLATADQYHSKLGSAAFLNQGGRFQYAFLVIGRQIDFATLDEDYDERGGRIYLAWLPSGAARISASADYSRRDYRTLTIDPATPGSPLRQDNDRNYLASLEYRLNQNLTVTFVGNQIRRESTAPTVGYVDRRVMLLLGYTFGHTFDIQSRR